MNPHVFRSRQGLPPQELKGCIEKFVGDQSLVIVEKDKVEFLRFQDMASVEARGRGFSLRGELRWQKEGQNYMALLITELVEETPSGWEPLNGFQWVDGPFWMELWGKYDQKHRGWLETSIPRNLSYPISSPEEGSWVLVKARLLGRGSIPQLTVFMDTKQAKQK